MYLIMYLIMHSPYFIQLPYVIGFLDIETYSLRQDAVVDEVGIILTNQLPVTDAPWSSAELKAHFTSIPQNVGPTGSAPHEGRTKCLELKMEVLEQILSGRHVDPETLRFRRETQYKASKAFPESVSSNLYDEYSSYSRVMILEAKEELTGLFGTSLEVKEMWMQHPQFDSTRICNLLGNGFNVPWWKYRAERDVATLKAETQKVATRLRLPDPYSIPAESQNKPRLEHVAIEDCFYNMWVVMKTHLFYEKVTGLVPH